MSALQIIGLEAVNMKALKAVRLTFDANDNLVTVGGENAAGKSSVLDVIESCLSNPVRNLARKGTEESRGTVILKDSETDAVFNVTRVIRSGQTMIEVTTEAPGGMGTTKLNKPSDFIKSLQGKSSLSLDPLDFLNGKPAEQRDILAEVLGIKGTLDAIEAECKERRAAYKLVEAKQKAAEDRFKAMPDYTDVPATEVEAGPLLAELQAINDRNAAKAKLRNQRFTAGQMIEDCQARVTALEAQIAELVRQKDEQLAKKAKLEQSLIENPEPEADESAAHIQVQIEAISETNKKVQANAEKARARVEWQKQEEIRATAFQEVRELEAEKKRILAAQAMPVQGLDFSFAEDQEQAFGVKGQSAYDGLTLNGIPFGSASHAQQLEAAVSIALAGAGRVRVILIRDASTLDNKKLKALAEAAQKQDALVIAEIVSNKNDDGSYDRRTTFTIEDGELVQAEVAA